MYMYMYTCTYTLHVYVVHIDINSLLSVCCSYSLLLCGICCTVNEKHDMANEVLELATTIDDHNTFAWTIRGNITIHTAHSRNWMIVIFYKI